MGGARKASRKGARSKVRPIDAAEIAAALVSEVERDGAVLKTVVARRSGPQTLAVFDALVHAGLEVTTRFVRRSLATQLLECVREGPVLVRGLDKLVRGATTREIAAAATGLAERGRARLVARGRDLLLAPADAPILDERTRQRLGAILRGLVASLAVAEKKGASLLRADVDAALKPFVDSPARPAAAILDIATLIEGHREASGLTFVPKLVRLLGGASARDAIHDALLREARAGRFELRPESGMGRLSSEDASFCIPGPQGSKLSWVRRREES